MPKRIAIVVACLLVTAVVVLRADRQEETPLRSSFALFPLELGPWQGVRQPPLSEQVQAVLGADDYMTRAYFQPEGGGVGLFIGFWRSQKQGDTIHSPLNCLPGAGWEPVSTGTLSFADPRSASAPDVSVNRVIIQKGVEKQMVLYWYQSHGRIVASEYWGKFYLMSDAISLNRTDGSIVRVIAPVTGEGPTAEIEAEKKALAFINHLLPELERYLPS
jgi:EpsI family protein